MHPRRLLIRDASITGGCAIVLITAASWWAFGSPAPAPHVELHSEQAKHAASVVPVTAVPTGYLWQPPPSAPAPPAPAPAAPSLRLLSLSHRGEQWTALIDPGDGTPAQRIGIGESVAGWRVDTVDGNAVALSSGQRQIRLVFAP